MCVCFIGALYRYTPDPLVSMRIDTVASLSEVTSVTGPTLWGQQCCLHGPAPLLSETGYITAFTSVVSIWIGR